MDRAILYFLLRLENRLNVLMSKICTCIPNKTEVRPTVFFEVRRSVHALHVEL